MLADSVQKLHHRKRLGSSARSGPSGFGEEQRAGFGSEAIEPVGFDDQTLRGSLACSRLPAPALSGAVGLGSVASAASGDDPIAFDPMKSQAESAAPANDR